MGTVTYFPARGARRLARDMNTDPRLAALSVAIQFEHVATTLMGPLTKEARIALAWRLYELANAQMALIRDDVRDMRAMSAHLAGLGVTDAVLRYCATSGRCI